MSIYLNALRAYIESRPCSAVVANRESRTNLHGVLRPLAFRVALRLSCKIDGRLVLIHCQKMRSFFETGAAQRTGRVDVPRSRCIQRLFAILVSHDVFLTSFI